ncbi:MAG TPA: hypothetical protein VHH11_20465 [Gammaproteobacteria bacterium]|jgi:hypothetical protein|nr:hypothetical protein [Gammaproteobacteria bacterium]
MQARRTLVTGAAALLLAALCVAHAQDRKTKDASAEEQAKLPTPQVELPPKPFKTAEEHYKYLLEKAHGGTKHTMSTIPVWDGLWAAGNNTMPGLFLVNGSLSNAWKPGAKVKLGVLTPPYEKQFLERRAQVEKFGEQLYDRLTNCEHPGVPRWLWEPYVKEFVNMPDQSWLMNDMMDETRRIYIGAEHINTEAKHFPLGDSIGFWDHDKLVIWTKWVNPADYVRGMPLTSNQFEMVETWQERRGPAGQRQLVTQVTFYDPLALVQPLSAVYTHDQRPDLKKAGVRIRSWECESSSNSYKAADGSTQFYLPGDPQYKNPRGTTDFPDLPGQSLNPIFDAQ